MKKINIPNEVWNKLNAIKDEEKIMHFADVIKFLITEREVSKNNSEEPIKHQPSIRSQILNLMKDGNTWNIQDLAAQSCQHVQQPAHVIYEFIESILDTIPNIIKVGDSEYRLAQASKA